MSSLAERLRKLDATLESWGVVRGMWPEVCAVVEAIEATMAADPPPAGGAVVLAPYVEAYMKLARRMEEEGL